MVALAHRIFLPLILTLLAGCAHPPAPAVPLAPRTLRLRGDIEFTIAERARISWTIRELREQSDGALRVEIVYDLDGTPTKEPRLIRAHPFASIFLILEEQKNGTLYGLQIRDSAGLRAYLLADRLTTDRLWIHTTMHELLHAFGAEHVSDPRAVLYAPTGTTWYNGIILTDADRAEIIRALAPTPPSPK